ncbi:hypothetical protein F7725_009414 [Dissostichus mawsoni]|uniref:Uncharacterized protein n=1 Tax=Dissostichus mawsoni TaxID=36200 RepID=A0A7J5XKN5_DISMA|nr:hypothetical protein F7725_009414 [Dissostichus mawsoni]
MLVTKAPELLPAVTDDTLKLDVSKNWSEMRILSSKANQLIEENKRNKEINDLAAAMRDPNFGKWVQKR